MVLVLNKPMKLGMPLNKETKQNLHAENSFIHIPVKDINVIIIPMVCVDYFISLVQK